MESDDVPDAPDPNQPLEFLQVWVPQGDWVEASRYAFAFISPAHAAANPAPKVWGALRRIFPAGAPPQVDLLPSSRGAMLLRFSTFGDRDSTVNLGRVDHADYSIEFVRPEDTDNRFTAEESWLVFVSASDFPLEHWFPNHIRAALAGIGHILEFDPACLGGYDYSSLRIILETASPARVPRELLISSPCGDGSVVQLTTLFAWQRTGDDNYLPFFGPPPPPPPSALPPPPPFFGPAPPPPLHPLLQLHAATLTRLLAQTSLAGPSGAKPTTPPSS